MEPIYSLRAKASPGRFVEVFVTPELHHGNMRNRYSGAEQGIFMITPSRDRDPFDNLMIHLPLAAGELLVLSAIPEADASLGHAFHKVGVAGRQERKLILVRPLQVPASEILADTSTLAHSH